MNQSINKMRYTFTIHVIKIVICSKIDKIDTERIMLTKVDQTQKKKPLKGHIHMHKLKKPQWDTSDCCDV